MRSLLNSAGLALVMAIVVLRATVAQQHSAAVPPTQEIEVVDPRVDSVGNPAVIIGGDPEDASQQMVDIPPTLIVHRFYYSGDRTFQGPMFPGGPSILVVNHPRTGERCYISAQMLPGAPKVTYRKSSIDYDYGKSGITLHFGYFTPPALKYRSGTTWAKKAAVVLHTEQLKTGMAAVGNHTAECYGRTKQATCGVLAMGACAGKLVVLPVQHTIRVLPFGAALTSGDIGTTLAERGAEHKRDHMARKAEQDQAWNSLDIRTNR